VATAPFSKTRAFRATAPRAAVAAGSRVRIASFPSVLRTNPYQRLLYDALRAHGFALAANPTFDLGWLVHARKEVGYLHFHWPQPFWRHEEGPRPLRRPLSYVKLGLFGLRLAAARALGYRVVWTVHQVLPHEVESERLDRLGARALAARSNLLIAHDGGTLESVRRELGASAGRKTAIVPHGSYLGVYPDGRSRDVVRASLGVKPGAFAFLCFGDLRDYKDVDRLLRAFSAARLPNGELIVAGSICAEAQGDEVRRHAAADPRVKPILRFVPDDLVTELFQAADAAVVARSDGGTSGSLILALSMGVPVVAARMPVYEQLLGGGTAGWLFDPGSTDSLGAALEAAAAAGPDERRLKGEAARAQAESLRWSEIGAQTAALLVGEAA
jgi:glycosyltransferase involved in cell wall biosynthesis